MATNPNLRDPERREEREQRPHIVEQVEKPSRVPWPLLGLLAAGVILAVIIYSLPRTPKAAPGPSAGQVPDQPFGNQLQMKSLRVSPAPTGGQVYIYGEIENTGSQPVGQVAVDASFLDAQGNVVQRETRNMEFLNGNKGAPEVSTAPLKTGATTPFRVGFDTIPEGWNHEVPRMQIVHVAKPGEAPIPVSEPGGVVTPPAGATGRTPTASPNGAAPTKPPE